MNKLMPYLLVIAFAALVTVRMGYVTYTYYANSFIAYAESQVSFMPLLE